ncbi:la-related protein 6C [Castanea sativa]|uniref:la-related protein 6C n=1 Tax=Castanea sativa TaxID=21020 RepID=UPI003F65159C
MAQAQPEKIQDSPEKDMKMKETSSVSFRFNAQAPEFVPRSQTQMPISGYVYPCFHFLGGNAGCGSNLFYVGDQDPAYLISNPNVVPPNLSKTTQTNDLQQKINKQVEYQFSDMSLLAYDALAKHINKDPEGYVPISVIASTKKIKSLVSNNSVLVQALRSSPRLVVSDDGKKVRRRDPFTERAKEELQSRTIVAENLPEDHSHQNLEKIFSVVGSVKTIRICHPQDSNSSRSKCEFSISNKLHALVEYETIERAEKAVEKLNDERNWRKGLRVKLLLRRTPKSVLKSRKSDFDSVSEDDEKTPPESSEDSSQPINIDSVIESNAEENSAGIRKGWARGRGKSRGRSQSHIGRGLIALSPQLCSSGVHCEASAKQASKGPRMPDGTRGFTMGRGKPLSTAALTSSTALTGSP